MILAFRMFKVVLSQTKLKKEISQFSVELFTFMKGTKRSVLNVPNNYFFKSIVLLSIVSWLIVRDEII